MGTPEPVITKTDTIDAYPALETGIFPGVGELTLNPKEYILAHLEEAKVLAIQQGSPNLKRYGSDAEQTLKNVILEAATHPENGSVDLIIRVASLAEHLVKASVRNVSGQTLTVQAGDGKKREITFGKKCIVITAESFDIVDAITKYTPEEYNVYYNVLNPEAPQEDNTDLNGYFCSPELFALRVNIAQTIGEIFSILCSNGKTLRQDILNNVFKKNITDELMTEKVNGDFLIIKMPRMIENFLISFRERFLASSNNKGEAITSEDARREFEEKVLNIQYAFDAGKEATIGILEVILQAMKPAEDLYTRRLLEGVRHNHRTLDQETMGSLSEREKEAAEETSRAILKGLEPILSTDELRSTIRTIVGQNIVIPNMTAIDRENRAEVESMKISSDRHLEALIISIKRLCDSFKPGIHRPQAHVILPGREAAYQITYK